MLHRATHHVNWRCELRGTDTIIKVDLLSRALLVELHWTYVGCCVVVKATCISRWIVLDCRVHSYGAGHRSSGGRGRR